MQIIQGEKVARKILSDLNQEVKKMKVRPGLAVFLVGNDEASKLYVDLKKKASKKIGIRFKKIHFSNGENSKKTEDSLIRKIQNLNNDNKTDGIIVQLPLPGSIDVQKVIDSINPNKDVDGFHPENVKLFFEDREYFWPVFPKAIMRLIESTNKDLSGKTGCVVANSERFGEVMAKALNKKGINADYVLTKNFKGNFSKIKKADILITACGVAGLIKGSIVKNNAIIIDGGISKKGKKVFGDVDFESVKGKVSYISAVPGGVGPVTVASLMENVVLASKL